MTNEPFAQTTDRNGNPLMPGDEVSFKLYPKGTARGTVTISKSFKEVMSDGSMLPALAIET